MCWMRRERMIQCSRKVVNGRKVAGTINSLVNVKGLSLECARVLHEGMLLPVLLYISETMVWNKKYRCKVQCVQMDNLRGMLGVKRINKVRNEPVSYTHLTLPTSDLV